MNSVKALLVKQVSALLLASAFSLATALCAGTQNATASPSVPSGRVNFSITNSPVYDLTGSYQFDQEVVAAGGRTVKVGLAFSLAQDAAGRLRGSGTTNVLVGNEPVAASYRVSGRITGGGNRSTRAMLSIRWQAQGTTGTNGPFTISVQYNLEVRAGLLNGQARGRAKFAQLGNGSIKTPISGVALPAGMDGSWIVQMNIQRPGGTGSIILSNDRTLQTGLAEKFAARSGLARIKLAGTGGDRGTTLSVVFSPGSGALASLSGKVLGQTVALKDASGSIVNQGAGQVASTFAGAQACLECHTPVQQTLIKTRHAQVGVQCENCHGPSAEHAANDYDPLTRPVVPFDGKLCGTCHSGPQHPIYEEWQTSEHAEVVTDLNPPDRISSCGRCHSGSVRVNLVDGAPLPVGHANVPLGCPTCHEPHQVTGLPHQLRNPLFSTQDYYLTTTSVFTNNYDPSVNLCAQCHNHRGASWANSSAPPHPSPQYNMLLGTVGELASGLPPNAPSYHALYIANQCVGCHMQTAPYRSPAQPAVTGHSFAVDSYGACADCHATAANASNLVVFVTQVITNRIGTIRNYLDLWATTRAPASLTAKYGTRAWEYTRPGELSPGGSGPDATEQAQIPVNIRKARFNLYLVLYDGSFGAHNGLHAMTLLDTAENWVLQELIR